MRDELERLRERMTEEEKAKIWEHLRGELRGREARRAKEEVRLWMPRLASAVGVAALVALLLHPGLKRQETSGAPSVEAGQPTGTVDAPEMAPGMGISEKPADYGLVGEVEDANFLVGPAPRLAIRMDKGTLSDSLAFLHEKGRGIGSARNAWALRMETQGISVGAEGYPTIPAIIGFVHSTAGDPVPNATVRVVETGLEAQTGPDGRFELRGLQAGTYTLQVTAEGYDELERLDVRVTREETLRLDLVLNPTSTGAGTSPGGEEKTEEAVADSVPDQGEDSLPESEMEEQQPDSSVIGWIQVGPEWGAETVRPFRFEGLGALGSYSYRLALLARRAYPSLTGGSRPVNDELADAMFFQYYGTHPFVDAAEDALSTFGLDVDTGSYTIVRRYLTEGSLPPTAAVRVEEFVNYFAKDYPLPEHADFRIVADLMPSPFAHVKDGRYWLLRIGIRARDVAAEDRAPTQLVLVIDRSGSMSAENRLEMVKAAVEELLGALRPEDEVAVVAFNETAEVVLPFTRVGEGTTEETVALLASDDTPADVFPRHSGRSLIKEAVRKLRPSGSTNAQDGLRKAYDLLREEARPGKACKIILFSDGVANVGDTGWESILGTVRRHSGFVTLSTIGVGMGNYNDVLLEQLADRGDGQYAYVDRLDEACRVLQEQATGILQTIARNAKAQIAFDPDVVERYRLLGYENRDIDDEDFRRNDVDAGEIGAGHEVTVLYEIRVSPDAHAKLKAAGLVADAPAPAGMELGTVTIRYEKPQGGEFTEVSRVVTEADAHASLDGAPPSLLLDASVAEFAEVLRGSYWAKDGSCAAVLELLQKLPEEWHERPEVGELMELVEKAGELGK
jgi:Ca-activated chloride channel family protein